MATTDYSLSEALSELDLTQLLTEYDRTQRATLLRSNLSLVDDNEIFQLIESVDEVIRLVEEDRRRLVSKEAAIARLMTERENSDELIARIEESIAPLNHAQRSSASQKAAAVAHKPPIAQEIENPALKHKLAIAARSIPDLQKRIKALELDQQNILGIPHNLPNQAQVWQDSETHSRAASSELPVSRDNLETKYRALKKNYLMLSLKLLEDIEDETGSSVYLLLSLMPAFEKLLERARALIPSLSEKLYKGQAGRVAVIGGSFEYTGAPYFSAFSALRTGADLAFIICDRDAATAIKSYSPEVIVYPTMISASNQSEYETSLAQDAILATLKIVERLAHKLSAIVIGPGLSRDHLIQATSKSVLKLIIEKFPSLPVIIDGDGLYMVQDNLDLIKNKKNIILTPNVAEFQRLCQEAHVENGKALTAALNGPIIVQKGHSDAIFATNDQTLECSEFGSPRRYGGQGDILAGCIATVAGWTSGCPDNWPLACWSACLLVRHAATAAYKVHGRSAVTSDMLAQIGGSFDALFGARSSGGSSDK